MSPEQWWGAARLVLAAPAAQHGRPHLPAPLSASSQRSVGRSGRRGGGGNGQRAFEQHTGFFKLFRKEERNFFLCLGAVCHRLADTHTRLSRSISSSGLTYYPSVAPYLGEGSSVSRRFNSR